MRTAVGILSWKAHETLRKTLASYAAGALTDVFGANAVYFNARSAEDDALAASFGWRAAGTPENLGLLGGTEALARALDGDILLMLQNDCPLCTDGAAAARYLRDAVALIAAGEADIVRCRHRRNPGEGFSDVAKYRAYWPDDGARDTLALKLKRLGRPFKARRMIGRAPYVLAHPAARHPQFIRRAGAFDIVDSAVINFTDQPFLIRKDFLLTLIGYAHAHPCRRTLNGMQVLEMCLNCRWWRAQHFRIAVGEGCFTHNRFDDSFRTDHHAFNAAVRNPAAT